MTKRTLAALAVAALIAIGCGASPADNGTFSEGRTAPAIDQPKGAPATTSADTIGEGTYAVGEDIKAGTYKTVVPADEPNCYWARLSSFDGGAEAITDNGNLSPGARGRVVVKKSDVGVEFRGGCEWKRAAK